jgi:hypothetical protein
MYGLTFEYLATLNKPQQIYQVVGTGNIRMLYFWKKKMRLENISTTPNYAFLSAERDCFLLFDRQLKKFTNNRNFIRLFEEAKQTEVKKYIKQNKIRVKKATNQEMSDLITFCNNLY